ncbi:MAG TPA: type II toxin-antitoxin system RelE/ParE family toxin [Candidatus Paceibacterota bacterium]
METGEFQNNQESSYEPRIVVLGNVLECIDALSGELSIKILADIKQLGTGKTASLLIKPLRGKLMELSVKQYRILYFRIEGTIYVVDVLKKQSRKTPRRIIKRAWNIYKKFE